VRIRTTLIAVIAGSALLPSTATAKEETEAFVVCGAEHCRELHGEVMRLASTLTLHAGRRPHRAAPFYDVFFIHRQPDGARTTPGGALRYIPSATAVRSHTASGDEVWFRVERRLALMLMQRIDGLRPRRASALEAPATEIGAATATAQRALAAQAVAAVAPAADATDEPPFELALIAAFGTIAAVAGLRQFRRQRRRSSIAARSG
jgi:hypothetical protein